MNAADRKFGLAVFAAVAVLGVGAYFAYPPLVVPITVGAATAVLAVLYRRWKDDAAFRVKEAVREIAEELDVVRSEVFTNRAEIEETRALVALQEPRFALPLPWTQWALPPRGLLDVIKTLQEFEAPTIIDCGSGVSTVHLARAVRELGGGRVIALEQDAAWAAYVQRILERNGLQPFAKIVVTPLAEMPFCGQVVRWFAVPSDLFGAGDRVDIVIADGPIGEEGTLARIGALPYFWDRLSDRGAVYLDDTTRPEEQEICRVWRENYPVTETSIGTEHGMSRFTRRSA